MTKRTRVARILLILSSSVFVINIFPTEATAQGSVVTSDLAKIADELVGRSNTAVDSVQATLVPEKTKLVGLSTAIEAVVMAAEEWKISAAEFKAKVSHDSSKNENFQPPGPDEIVDAQKAVGNAEQKYEQALVDLEKLRGDRTSAKSDHSSKHFTLLVGAVVLDPFKLEKNDSDSNAATVNYQVGESDTKAAFLIEAGARRRWAWENWLNPEVDQLREDLRAVRSQVAAEQAKEQPSPELIQDWQKRVNEINLELRRRARVSQAAFDFRVYPGRTGRAVTNQGWRANFASNAASFLLVPDNFAVRVGFVPGSDSPAGAAAVAGGGNFYLETGMGFDWMRVLYSSGIEPMRVTVGPEVIATFSNNPKLDDFHQRVLTGGHITAGIPISNDDERAVEIVVRAGWVYVDVPDFLDSTSREIRVKNGVPKFDNEEGFGIDAEVNMPILEELGFVFLRVTSNHGMDPNPWTTTVGYTIPIDTLVGMVRQ